MATSSLMKPRFFPSPAEFRTWLQQHHDQSTELWVGFYKKNSDKPSITWPEAVGQALCFGWIDGIRKSLDAASYVIRFTPRTASSTWSAVNIARAKELVAQGLMSPAGLQAFEKRTDEKSAIYSYEQRKSAQLTDAQETKFRARRRAWEFFQAQPPWYRRTATYWVISAKKEETREKRFAALMDYSERQKSIPQLDRSAGKKH
jgi:uncharacterized protein YdeI (YjbR/CyaY-like superfamily)